MSNAFLRFWGVRGSYSAPFSTHLGVGGNTSCVEINTGDHLLVCDAGTGIIPLGNRLMQQQRLREMMIILTHYHWDHICGLPFFVPAFSPEWTIHMFGPGENGRQVEELIAAQMKAPYFPVETGSWMADIDYLDRAGGRLHYGPLEIEYQSVHHPGVTYGYRIHYRDKTIVYVSDNECLYLEKSIAQRYQEFDRDEQALMDKMQAEEKAAELRLIEGADILIHDAQYTPEDYSAKRGWGHSCYIDTVNSAIDAGVKELYLFHHDPNYDDATIAAIHEHSQGLIRERGSDLQCLVAREEMVVEL